MNADVWLEGPYTQKATEDMAHEMFQDTPDYEMALAEWALEQDPGTLADDETDWDDIFQAEPEYATAFDAWITRPER